MKKQSVVKKFLYSQKVAPYVFVMPFILTFAIFFAYSIVSMILMSFQKVAGANTTFIGLENYKILTNAVFLKSLKNSVFYTIVTCIMMIPIPMILAAMLNSKHMRAKGTFRSILFIPALTSVRKPVTVWITLFFLCLWRWTGVNMMYYLSGLQQIPADLYESASIDGATGMQQLRYITIPLLKPTTIYVLTISIFGGMAMFSESYMLFNGNKSPNNVATTLVGMLYRMGFEQNQLGIASAIGVIFLLIVLAVNMIQLRINGTIGSKKGE